MDLIALYFPGRHGEILKQFRENWSRVFLSLSTNTKWAKEKEAVFFLTSQISRTAGLADRNIPAKFYKDLQS